MAAAWTGEGVPAPVSRRSTAKDYRLRWPGDQKCNVHIKAVLGNHDFQRPNNFQVIGAWCLL